MNKKVLVISFSFEQEKEAYEVLSRAGFEVVTWANKDRKGCTEADLIEYWNGMERKPEGIVMGADIPVGETFLSQCSGLEAVSLNCAGSDHLDLEAFRTHQIPVCNVPRQNFDAVADFIWGQILGLMRRIPQGDKNIRAGKWCEGVERGIAVSKKTLGIIGFGAIGKAVAKRAAGFDMEVIVSSTSENAEAAQKLGVTYVSRDRLFASADIIVPACPAVPETYHMIGERAIGLMKREAVIVNAARGQIIDTDALYRALASNRIAGAALDVFEEEPLWESRLFELDNVVLTPHMGGLADREIRNVAVASAKHMVLLLNNQQTGTEL